MCGWTYNYIKLIPYLFHCRDRSFPSDRPSSCWWRRRRRQSTSSDRRSSRGAPCDHNVYAQYGCGLCVRERQPHPFAKLWEGLGEEWSSASPQCFMETLDTGVVLYQLVELVQLSWCNKIISKCPDCSSTVVYHQ